MLLPRFSSSTLPCTSIVFASLSFVSIVFASDFTGRVIGVMDGDTTEVLHHKTPQRIRLFGIDCPEKAQTFGQRAKQARAALVFSKIVTIESHGHDKYKRTLGDVFLSDGTHVNRELVAQGWCWWYQKYAPDDVILASLEAAAQVTKKGLWADPNLVPPWVYRKESCGHRLTPQAPGE